MAASTEKIVVTRDMVFESASALKAAGIEPTNRKLLHELGGSMTTIAGFLRDWKAQQSIVAPVAVEALDVPAAVVDAGHQAVSAIWHACHAEARREIEVVTEQANQRILAAETDRDKILMEVAEADAELTVERDRAAALDASLIELRAQHAAMQAQNEHLVNEEQKAKAVAEETSRRADELADSFRHERDRADKLAADVAALQPVAQRVATVESDNIGLQAEVVRLRQDLVTEREQRDAQAKVERSLTADLATAQARAAGLAEQLDEVKQRGAEESKRLDGRAQRAEQERDAARKELEAAAVASGKLTGQVEALQRQVSEQVATLRALSPSTETKAGAQKGDGKR